MVVDSKAANNNQGGGPPSYDNVAYDKSVASSQRSMETGFDRQPDDASLSLNHGISLLDPKMTITEQKSFDSNEEQKALSESQTAEGGSETSSTIATGAINSTDSIVKIPLESMDSGPLLTGDDKREPGGDGELHQTEEVDRERETWTNKFDFLLACIGFSVGLGNVWRFPYLCYRNGGGAFLIPYLICVLIGGIPMFFLEVALGQFMTQGGIMAWDIAPLFRGIGYASAVIVFFLNCYYNIILSWSFYYVFSSFTTELPWSACGHEWNTNETCTTNFSTVVSQRELRKNATNFTLAFDTKVEQHPVVEFWEKKVLAISSGIDDTGTVKWDICLCLLLGWLVVYFCIWKGIRTSGKTAARSGACSHHPLCVSEQVMYVTATSPYIFMFILMIRGLTLEGAGDGIKYYLMPNMTRMADAQVWVDAGTQIFFSYSISLGTLTALGSYNKFNHNSYRDAIVFSLVNSGTSIFSGFVIFSVLGYMANQQQVDVGDVAASGPGLAFIAYPMALAKMPAAPIWSVFFFIMIILLGLDSEFVGVEGFITAVGDIFPNFMRRGHNREIFIACKCFACFLVGLSMVTNGGMYVFQIFDFYSGSRIILLIALLECIAIGWIYGADRFLDNLYMMYGFRISPIWKYFWMYITPVFCVAMFILSAIVYKELTYELGNGWVYRYPPGAIAFGWIMAVSSILLVPIYGGVKIFTSPGDDFFEKLRASVRPMLAPHQLRPCDDPAELDPAKAPKRRAAQDPAKIDDIALQAPQSGVSYAYPSTACSPHYPVHAYPPPSYDAQDIAA